MVVVCLGFETRVIRGRIHIRAGKEAVGRIREERRGWGVGE